MEEFASTSLDLARVAIFVDFAEPGPLAEFLVVGHLLLQCAIHVTNSA